MRSVLQVTLLAVVFFVLSRENSAVAAAQQQPLFASDDMLHLTISGPLTRMWRTDRQRQMREPAPGLLTVEGVARESLPIELSVRGLTRSRKEICPFPPLRVEFTEKPAADSLFKGQRRLKLVTHCRPAEDFQQHILLEYAAYRLHSALTPESFEVRLALIDYVRDDGSAITSRVGFFIEDVDDVAWRNEQKRLRDTNSVSVSQLDSISAARVALFQYMIGNLDWSVIAAHSGEDCCHNSRLMGKRGEMMGLVPVPYDFDFSGLVDAPYAVPPDGIRVRNVRVRHYRGFCQHNEEAQAVAADMLAHRASLLAILDETPLLNQETMQQGTRFLNDFFDQIGSPMKVAELLEDCR